MSVLTVELVAAILGVALSFGLERHVHFHALDVIMHGHVESLIGAVQESSDGKDQVALVRADVHMPKDDVWEVFDETGRQLGISSNWQGVAPETIPTGRGTFGIHEAELTKHIS